MFIGLAISINAHIINQLTLAQNTGPAAAPFSNQFDASFFT